MSGILQSASVARVRKALAEAGLDCEIVELPGAARTARAAAQFLGCDVQQIANSLVFRGRNSGAAVLVLSAGSRRVDLARLESLAGEPMEKADADFVREKTGFAIGGVAPVGHATPMRTFVEKSLAACPSVWAAGGHPHTVLRLTYAELVRVTGGTEADAAVSP